MSTLSDPQLVLSLFPGIGLLDMAFEEAGFCVVRGPDLLWGGDVRSFHPPAGKFDGVIGGPPCKCFSPLANIVRAVHGEDSVAPNLIPEFERIVHAAQPKWFLMENVIAAPCAEVPGYYSSRAIIRDHWCGGETSRERKFTFGQPGPFRPFEVETLALHSPDPKPTVTTNSGGRRKVIAYDSRGRVRGKQGHADNARLKWRSIEESSTHCTRDHEEREMPTGYTSDVKDGKVTEFGDFAMQCARAFGACITMRDDPADTPIPDAFEPCSYYADRIREDEAKLGRLRVMNVDERAAAAATHNAEKLASWERYENDKKVARQRYEAMLAMVDAWEPPTSDHKEMKEFMRQQLTESIRFDCGETLWPRPEPLKRDDWHAQEIAETERSLIRHKTENQNEIDRAAKRTAWVAALRKSLFPEPPTSSV